MQACKTWPPIRAHLQAHAAVSTGTVQHAWAQRQEAQCRHAATVLARIVLPHFLAGHIPDCHTARRAACCHRRVANAGHRQAEAR